MKSVIFDMDGTILDTERLYQKYWYIAAHDLGYDLTHEDFLEFRSLGHSFGTKLMEEKTGDPEAYVRIRNYRKAMMEPMLEETEIPLKPYVKEALSLLRENGFRLAVATATKTDRTEHYLKRTGLIEYFDKLISARDVKEGKPSPDVYLYALQQMNVAAEDAFAVEDAPNGVLSADAAGIKTIMVPDLTEPDDELKKHIAYRADDLLDAAKYITGGRYGKII